MATRPAATWVRLSSGVNLVAGLWLVVAPFALGYADIDEALWNDVIVGVLIAGLAVVRLAMPMRNDWVSWVNFFLGGWLVVAPFALNPEVDEAVANDVTVGIVVAVLAIVSTVASLSAKTHTTARTTDG